MNYSWLMAMVFSPLRYLRLGLNVFFVAVGYLLVRLEH